MQQTFNLIREPWIRVMKEDYSTAEISLAEVFANAHQYRALAGELPMQDTAMLRLLLLVLYAVFLRYAPDGSNSPIIYGEETDIDEAKSRWIELWKQKRFPGETIAAYLEKYSDRFYLFDDKRPFYQVPMSVGGTAAQVNKLDAGLDKSTGKKKLLTNVDQLSRTSIPYGEAARWLVNFIAYGDCSAKKPSPKQTWLSNLEAVYVSGENLFETLMLNLVLYDVENTELWPIENESDLPLWERTSINTERNRTVLTPSNPMGMLAIQSRKVSLIPNKEKNQVEEFVWGGGDCFEAPDAFAEQMTAFSSRKKEENKYFPQKNDHAKFLWRDFATLTITTNVEKGENSRIPSVIRWQDKICKTTGKRSVDVHMTRISYGTMSCGIVRMDSGELSFNNGLLSDLAEKWRIRIKNEVAKAEELADYVGNLAKDLVKAGGAGLNEKQAKEMFFYRIDMPFRLWLQGIDPTAEISVDETVHRWRETERRIIKALAKELVEQAGDMAFVGRIVKEKSSNKEVERLYCSPKCYNYFNGRIAESLKDE